MDIFANSPEILLSDGRRSPGNKYTPEEIAIIENVAVELKEKMKIKRHIYIYDDTLDQAHEVTESRQRFSPPTNPPADGKR